MAQTCTSQSGPTLLLLLLVSKIASMKSYPAIMDSSDILVVIPTQVARLPLAHASRAWRNGTRAVLIIEQQDLVDSLNAEFGADGELYGYLPDDGASAVLGALWHGSYPGDTRAALAPFLAHRLLKGQYKWLLYGDDDTLFFLPALQRLIKEHRLDPNLPHAVSDHFWYKGKHPSYQAPRCLPCSMGWKGRNQLANAFREAVAKGISNGSALSASASQALREGVFPLAACPYCTPQLACAGLIPGNSNQQQQQVPSSVQHDVKDDADSANLPPPDASSSAPCSRAGVHGGAGAILSVGLLNRIPYEWARDCVLSQSEANGGDALLSECLWRAGFAFTDPGSAWNHASEAFVGFAPPGVDLAATAQPSSSSGPAGIGGMQMQGLGAIGVLSQLQAGGMQACGQQCMWQALGRVSMHLHARSYSAPHLAAAALYGEAYAAAAAESLLGQEAGD